MVKRRNEAGPLKTLGNMREFDSYFSVTCERWWVSLVIYWQESIRVRVLAGGGICSNPKSRPPAL
jgi:hypothetical protein